MFIPVFANVQFIKEDGYLTPYMQMYNDDLNNTLRAGLSDNGWTIPQVTNAELLEIHAYTGLAAMPDGTLWYVTDASPPTLVVQISGALKKITTTAYP